MRIIFLAKFTPETTAEQADRAIRVAAEALATGPFEAWEHGRGLRLSRGGGAHGADWGFVLDIDPGKVEEWRNSAAHEAMGAALRPVCAEGMSLEY